MFDLRKHFTLLLILSGVCASLVAIAIYYTLPETRNRYVIYTTDSVHGMVVTAPVEYKGVTVGEVEDIQLTDTDKVKLIVAIDKNIVITTKTRAALISRGLASRGFTGYIYIALTDVNTQDPLLIAQSPHHYPVITTTASESDNIDLAIYEVKNDVDKLTNIIGSTLNKDAQRSLNKILANMEQITDMLVVNNARLNTLIINTEKVSAQFGTLVTSGVRAMNLFEFQVFPEIYQTLNQVNHFVEASSGIVNKIEQDPSVFLRGTGTPVRGPGE